MSNVIENNKDSMGDPMRDADLGERQSQSVPIEPPFAGELM